MTPRDYNAHPAHVELAMMYSSVLVMGPPMSDKLIAIIAHLFTPEEARLARHLSFMYPQRADRIARKSGMDTGVLSSLLDAMVRKRIIISFAGRFMLYPLIPGAFEHILKSGDNGAWHATFAERINDLVDTGYMGDYLSRPINAVRSIPVHREVGIKTGSVVADIDLVSEIIDAHSHFGVYNTCPCRHSMHLTGHDCRRASADDGCLAFGDYSLGLAKEESGRSVSKEEMRDIIAERRAKGLVFFTSNILPSSPTAICTCCDCCCRALKIHNSFSKNLVAPPRSVAVVDDTRCTNCGRCVAACNTYAHTIRDGMHRYDGSLCIGCGMCVGACGTAAISMAENPAYRPPSATHARLILHMLPQVLLTGVALKLKRYFSRM
jgi:ferredoxin